ncbi:MAG: acyl-CoA dehydratase activase [Bacillota bacterium]
MIVAGIDIGSLSAEAVLLEKKNIIGYRIMPVGADSRRAAESVFAAVLGDKGLSREDVGYIVATGYGRVSVPFADRQVTEITCHGRGAVYVLPGSRTVVDIGGQDSKAIRVNERGAVQDFAMNDRCAAGTGRFLEVMARALETDLVGFNKLAEAAERASTISSVCTVFAESEVVSLISRGVRRSEIALGLCAAVAERVAALVHRVGLGEEVTMTGGVAKNKCVVEGVSQRLGVRVAVPPEPQIIGALGAALLAWGLLIDGPKEPYDHGDFYPELDGCASDESEQ